MSYFGIDSTAEFQQKATDLMLFAAAFAKIIDMMQAACFDNRAYQSTKKPLPTELNFGLQKSYKGECAELKEQIDSFLNTLYEWIRQQVFSNIPANEQHSVS